MLRNILYLAEMNLCVAVFGITGKTGLAFLEVIRPYLGATVSLRALVRSRSRVPPWALDHAACHFVVGDVHDSHAVDSVLHGSSVVISLIGHDSHSPMFLQRDAILVLVSQMDLYNQKLISLTGSGAFVPEDTPNFFDRATSWSISYIDPARVADGAAHIDTLFHSHPAFHWTVVRTPVMLPLAYSKYSIDLHVTGVLNLFTTYAAVAQMICDTLISVTDASYNGVAYFRTCPVVRLSF